MGQIDKTKQRWGGEFLATFDIAQFLRFLLTGVTATAGNFSVTWIARHAMPFAFALIPGMIAGAIISFLTSKMFAFRSHSWRGAHGEAARFAVVNVCGLAVYWTISVLIGKYLLPSHLPVRTSEFVGMVVGAGVMAITSYFGHQRFTYRQDSRLEGAEAYEPSARR